jgi:hypothetical protein
MRVFDSGLAMKRGQYNIFTTGCVNGLGSNTRDTAFAGANMLALILRKKTGIPFEAFNLHITLMSATVKLGYLVNIVELSRLVLNADLKWNQEKKFSGLVVRFENDDGVKRYHITYTIYQSGTCLLSGLKTMTDAEIHYNTLCDLTRMFKRTDISAADHQIELRMDYRLPDFLKNATVKPTNRPPPGSDDSDIGLGDGGGMGNDEEWNLNEDEEEWFSVDSSEIEDDGEFINEMSQT